MDTLKVCRVCEVEKPLMDFNNDRTSKDGKDSKCRECHSIYQKSIKEKRKAHTEFRKAIEGKCHWNNKKIISEMKAESSRLTKETGIKRQVDHVLPLLGTKVWGFHHEDNLEIIKAKDNMGKGNSVTKEMLETEELRLMKFFKNNNL